MRGEDVQQRAMYNYLSPEERVPAKHPLRAIRHSLTARQAGQFASKLMCREPPARQPGRHVIAGLPHGEARRGVAIFRHESEA